jgi:hypothetical protein
VAIAAEGDVYLLERRMDAPASASVTIGRRFAGRSLLDRFCASAPACVVLSVMILLNQRFIVTHSIQGELSLGTGGRKNGFSPQAVTRASKVGWCKLPGKQDDAKNDNTHYTKCLQCSEAQSAYAAIAVIVLVLTGFVCAKHEGACSARGGAHNSRLGHDDVRGNSPVVEITGTVARVRRTNTVTRRSTDTKRTDGVI